MLTESYRGANLSALWLLLPRMDISVTSQCPPLSHILWHVVMQALIICTYGSCLWQNEDVLMALSLQCV